MSATGLYIVNYDGFAKTDHLTFSEAKYAPDEQADPVYEVAGHMADQVLKVSPNGVFVAGEEAAAAIFNMKYAQGHAPKQLLADNDNKSISPVRYEFGCARLGVQCRIGHEFHGAAAANVQRAPQMGMALNA